MKDTIISIVASLAFLVSFVAAIHSTFSSLPTVPHSQLEAEAEAAWHEFEASL